MPGLLLGLAFVWVRAAEVVPAGEPLGEVTELVSGPVPGWVEPVTWEPSSIPRPGFPAELLLNDAQASLRADGCDYHFHWVARLINREGVRQNAEQSVTFSPEYERVIWHVLRIHRGGETIDLLPKTKFKRLQRELGLEGKVYDGRVTAVAVLEDIRVGDSLEVAYTMFNTNPLLKGYPGFRMSLGSAYPVKQQSIVVRMPAELPSPTWYFFLPPDTQGLPEDIFGPARMRGALEEKSTEAERIFRWAGRDLAGVPFDQAISGEAAPYYPTIRCSSFAGWSQVAKWALPLFDTGEPLPAELGQLVDRWKTLPDPATRLRAAVDWVQGDIRYFSMAFGPHNVKPRPMAEVVSTRFGDCKDKAVLLSSLLRALDIPAWPALVNTYSEHLVRQGGPDIHAFNHAIVAYEWKDGLRWVDATLRQPAGEPGEWKVPPSYSPALILRSDEVGVTNLPAAEGALVDSETLDRVRLDPATGAAEIAMEVRLRGLQADYYRMSLDEVTDDQRAKGWFNYLARFYPRLEELEPPKVEDDRKRNELILRALYRLPEAVRTENGERLLQLYAYALRTVIDNPESRRRHWPLALPYGRNLRHRIEIDLPEEVAAFVRPTVVRTKEFEYRSEKAGVGRRYTAVHDLQINARHVAPERMIAFADSIEEALREMASVVRLTGSPGASPPAEIKSTATP